MGMPIPCPLDLLSNPKLGNSPQSRLQEIDSMIQQKIIPGRWIGHARGKHGFAKSCQNQANMILLD